MATIFIIGANRGLGLELARQYAESGWQVLASCRNESEAQELKELQETYPSFLEIFELDVVKKETLQACVERLTGRTVDVLFYNAGVFLGKGQRIGAIDYEEWARIMEVNLFGAMATVEAFLPFVTASGKKKIAFMTSLMGSITDNVTGGSYLYRTSKAALNMLVKNLAIELRSQGVTVLAFHPGWVKTDIGGDNAPLTVEESVEGVRMVLNRLKESHTGRFFDYAGVEIPW